MLSVKPNPSRFVTVLFTLLIVATFSLRLQAQDSNGNAQTPYIDDWSHHHLVFSNPGTREDAVKNGKLEEWNRITNNPRYLIQKGKREHGNRQVPDGPGGDIGSGDFPDHHGHHDGGNPPPSNRAGIEKDWNTGMGAGSTATLTGTFSALPSSASGSITIVDGAHTLTMTTNATASDVIGTFTQPLASSSTITITSGSNTLTMTSAGSTYAVISAQPANFATESIAGTTYTWSSLCTTFNTNFCIARSGTTSTDAANLANAINGICSGTGTCTANNNINAVASGSDVFIVSTSATTQTLNNITGVTFNSTTLAIPSTNACSSNATTGTFAPDISTTNLATNLKTALNLCPTGAGLATTTSATNTVTVKASVLGGTTVSAFSAGGTNLTTPSTLFAWGTPTNGVIGTSTCPTPYTAGTFATAASTTTVATNLATEITGCNTGNAATGVTALGNANTVNLTADTPGPAGDSITTSSSFTGFTWGSGTLTGGAPATVQPNMYPAKWGASLTGADCLHDYVVYPTGQPGGAGAANIIAYNNLYTSGCTGTVPQAYWAFNTGTGYSVSTAPIVSQDGHEVVFVQSNGTQAQLVVLKWAASSGTLTTPTSLTATGNISTCTAPCMTVTTFGNSHDDTYSAPYYDYASDDAVFVGDDSGDLQKFTGVLNGTSVSVATPLALGSHALGSPVYDSTSGYVIVGDMGGILYSVTASTMALHGTTGTAEPVGDAIVDAPIVDSSAGTVYVFVNQSGNYSETGFNALYQYTTGFTGIATPAPGVVALWSAGAANGATGHYLYAGTFDNVYYQSATHTGSLYVVANTGVTTGATLYRVPINSGSLATPVAAVTGLTASGAYPWPSPLTEYCNGTCTSNGTITTGGTDYVFFSVNQGNVSGCTTTAGNGCILSYNVTNPASIAISGSGQNFTTPASPGCWATSGIVVDNDAALAGASEIYFVNLNGAAAGGPNGNTSSACAVGSGPTIDAIQAAQNNP